MYYGIHRADDEFLQWINDIVLCNYNRTLVSASSDSLVLAWNPHSSSHEEQVTPMQVGRHGDYVRCLAAARDAHWVASGGFDRKIRLWDIGEGRSSSVREWTVLPFIEDVIDHSTLCSRAS